jgi:hypothetical protein
MNVRSLFVLIGLTLAVAALTFAGDKKDEHPASETGTLMEMAAVPCGSTERGVTGFGSLLATAGLEHVNATDKLCQEYVLRGGFIQYRLRPVDEKHPVLLPVGEKAHFYIKGDRILLTVAGGDDRQREYRVVGMKPLLSDADTTSHPTTASAAADAKPVN